MATIRPIERSEMVSWVAAMHAAYFVDRSAEEEAEYRADRVEYPRTIGAFDGDRVVGTLRSFPTELTVPGGGCIQADAVTNVAVLPTHRRRGLLTAMMARDLQDASDRGDVVSILGASEYPIYGRYGYGHATDIANLVIDRASARFRVPGDGSVELVPIADLRPIAPPIYERFRLAQPGSIALLPRWWDAAFGTIKSPYGPKPGDLAVVCRDASGAPQGWLRYRVEETWADNVPTSKLTVQELVAATNGAYARLWRFTTEVDLVATIRAGGRSVAEPLPWLLEDGRAVRRTSYTDGLWIRVLDPIAALAARTYTAPGEVVLEVTDDAGFAAGRYRLEGGPHGGRVERTSAAPDLVLTVRALGTAYLGYVSLGTLAGAGLIEERRPGSLARTEAMFSSPVVPWCSVEF